MDKKYFLFGNWKMALTLSESATLANALIAGSPQTTRQTTVGFAPTFTALSKIREIIKDSAFQLGAQNVSSQLRGAFTGEVPGSQLNELGVSFALIGHSERRDYYGETNDTAALRAKAAVEQGITAVFCVGEKLSEREGETTNDVIAGQLKPAFTLLKKADWKNVVIAYEPKWAIGTGKVPTTVQISDVHSFIRNLLIENSVEAAGVIYGGSVTPENFAEIIAIDAVDGALPGGASLKAESFLKLLAIAEEG